MDNFNQTHKDQIPEFLVKSVKRKARLSVCDVNFRQSSNRQSLTKNKKSLSNFPTNISIVKHQSQQLAQERHKKQLVNRQIFFQTQQMQNKNQQKKYQIERIQKSKSQHRLPALAKFNVQLKMDEDRFQSVIRLNKQILKPKIMKKLGHYRQLSQKNSIVRIKQDEKVQDSPQIRQNSLQKQELKAIQQKKQKCYYIRNLMLNANISSEFQNKQRASLNMLVNKLRQTERRGKQSIILSERKLEKTPNELIANKVAYQQLQKNTIKQQIMRKFTMHLNQNQSNRKKQSNGIKKKEEQFLTGWHAEEGNAIQQHHQQF